MAQVSNHYSVREAKVQTITKYLKVEEDSGDHLI